MENTLTVVNLQPTRSRQLWKWRFHCILTVYRGIFDTARQFPIGIFQG